MSEPTSPRSERVREAVERLRETATSAGMSAGEVQALLDEALRANPQSDAETLRVRPGDDVAPTIASPTPAPEPEPSIGRDIGRYRVLHELGHGGMGVVYRANDKTLGRDVALKVLSVGDRPDRELLDRFQREARAAAAMDHPHIVKVLDVGELPPEREGEAGKPFYTMELLSGEDLAHAIGGGSITPRDAVEVTRQVALALAYAHGRGVLHRDVKPQNIFLRAEAHSPPPTADAPTAQANTATAKVLHAMLVDFGLAKFIEREYAGGEDARRVESLASLTQSGQVLGTPVYMAPEQVKGLRDVDARADVYALGATLYHMLTGQPPITGNSLGELLQAVQTVDPVSPRKRNARIDRDVETLCLKSLAKEPAGRYATAGDLAEDCRRYLAGEPLAARPVGLAGRIWRRAKRNRAVAGLLVTVVLVVVASIVAGALGLSQWRQDQTIAAEVERAGRLLQRGDAEGRKEAVAALDALLARHPDHRAAWILRARGRISEGNWREGLSDLDAALALASSPDVRLDRARTRFDAGLVPDALVDLDALLREAPRHREALRLRGLARAEQGDLDAAGKDFQALLATAASAAEALEVRCYQARIRIDAGEAARAIEACGGLVDEAMRALDASGAQDKAWARSLALAHLVYARALRNVGQDDDAIRQTDRALALDPSLLEANIERVRSEYNLRGGAVPWEVDAASRQVAEQAPWDVRTAWLSAQVAWRIPPRAESDPLPQLNALLERFPHWVPAHVRKGDALLRKGDLTGAKEAYRDALALSPSEPMALVGLGRVAMDLGETEDAITLFEEASRAAPRLHPALAGLAEALGRAGRADEAALAWARTDEVGRGEGEPATMAASIEERYFRVVGPPNAGIWDKSQECFREALVAECARLLALDPWSGGAWLCWGTGCAIVGEWEAALHAYEGATRSGPAAAYRAHLGAARLLAVVPEVRSAERAASEIERALALRPGHWEALFERGVLHLLRGEKDQALSDLSAAIAASPEEPSPRYFRAELLAGLGREEEARADRQVWKRGDSEERQRRARPWVRMAQACRRPAPVAAAHFTERAVAEASEYALAYLMRGELGFDLLSHGRLPDVGARVVDMVHAVKLEALLMTRLHGRIQTMTLNRTQKLFFPAVRASLDRTEGEGTLLQFGMAYLDGAVGKHEASLQGMEAVLADSSTFLAARVWRAWMLHKLGRSDEASRELEEIEREAPGIPLVAYFRGCLSAATDPERAIGLLEFAKRWGFEYIDLVRAEPALAPLRTREDFRARLPGW